MKKKINKDQSSRQKTKQVLFEQTCDREKELNEKKNVKIWQNKLE